MYNRVGIDQNALIVHTSTIMLFLFDESLLCSFNDFHGKGTYKFFDHFQLPQVFISSFSVFLFLFHGSVRS